MSPEAAFEAEAPEIVSEVQVQVWDLRSRTLLFRLDGHLGFTTKQCPHVCSARSRCPPSPLLLGLLAPWRLVCYSDRTPASLPRCPIPFPFSAASCYSATRPPLRTF